MLKSIKQIINETEKEFDIYVNRLEAEYSVSNKTQRFIHLRPENWSKIKSFLSKSILKAVRGAMSEIKLEKKYDKGINGDGPNFEYNQAVEDLKQLKSDILKR